MPERELLNVKLKIENGKLRSGRQFAKCKTLLPDFFSLYGSKCLIVAANRVRQSFWLQNQNEQIYICNKRFNQ